MCAIELVVGYRPGRVAFATGLGVALIAAAGNLWALHDGFNQSRGFAEIVRGDLAGLDIAADTVDPNLVLDAANSGFNYFTLLDAGSYLSAADKFGSPAYTADELLDAPESSKVAADKVLATALGLHLAPVPSPKPLNPHGCQRLPGSGDGPGSVTLPAGGALLTSQAAPGAEILVRRFAQDSWPVDLGLIEPHERATLQIPSDRSDQPWQISVQPGGGEVAVCPLGG
jgi:hypothetical protein